MTIYVNNKKCNAYTKQGLSIMNTDVGVIYSKYGDNPPTVPVYNITIIPTPADAEVKINDIITNNANFPEGSNITYQVLREGYELHEGSITLTKNEIIEVTIIPTTWKQSASYSKDGCKIIENTNMGPNSNFLTAWRNGYQKTISVPSKYPYYSGYFGSDNTDFPKDFILSFPRPIWIKTINAVLIGGASSKGMSVAALDKNKETIALNVWYCQVFDKNFVQTTPNLFDRYMKTLRVNAYTSYLKIRNTGDFLMAYGCYMAALRINT